MSQVDLGLPHLPRAFIAAVEKGIFCPSSAALDTLANRLALPAMELQALRTAAWSEQTAPASGKVARSIAKLEREDLELQLNYARMPARESRVEEALQVIDDAEACAVAYGEGLQGYTLYSVAYARARAYVQTGQLSQARLELEKALQAAAADHEASTRTLNMLGAIFYAQENPNEELHQHLEALNSLHTGQVHATTRIMSLRLNARGHLRSAVV
ncbi:MAG: hypothetical protein ABI670_11825 [Chloroflexota bacterium]